MLAESDLVRGRSLKLTDWFGREYAGKIVYLVCRHNVPLLQQAVHSAEAGRREDYCCSQCEVRDVDSVLIRVFDPHHDCGGWVTILDRHGVSKFRDVSAGEE